MFSPSIKPVHFTEEETEDQRKVSDLAQYILGWCYQMAESGFQFRTGRLSHVHSPLSHADSLTMVSTC